MYDHIYLVFGRGYTFGNPTIPFLTWLLSMVRICAWTPIQLGAVDQIGIASSLVLKIATDK